MATSVKHKTIIWFAPGFATGAEGKALFAKASGVSLLGHALSSFGQKEHTLVVYPEPGEAEQKLCEDHEVKLVDHRQVLEAATFEKIFLDWCQDAEGPLHVVPGDVPALNPLDMKTLAARHSGNVAAGLGCKRAFACGLSVDETGRITEVHDAENPQENTQHFAGGAYVFAVSKIKEALMYFASEGLTHVDYFLEATRLLANAQPGFAVPLAAAGQAFTRGADLAPILSEINKQQVALHLSRGVVIPDPDKVYIEPQVTIGKGTVVFPFTVIRSGVTVAEHCEVGPFTHLRKGTHMQPHAEVGNFTEVKNSSLGEHTKAKHLSYLGDGQVGQRVNIGAGTIFANYDGKHKHKTVVEDGAFIGSGTILVAPITVGAEGATGAGAVVTKGKDIPRGGTVVGVPAKPLKEQA